MSHNHSNSENIETVINSDSIVSKNGVMSDKAVVAIYKLNKTGLCELFKNAKSSYINLKDAGYNQEAIVYTFGLWNLQRYNKIKNRVPDENTITDSNALTVLRDFLSDKNYGSNGFSMKYAVVCRLLDIPYPWYNSFYGSDNKANAVITTKIINMVIDKLDHAITMTDEFKPRQFRR